MSLKNEKYKNKLENGRKKKFGKEFAEIQKGKHYVEELEPLIGAAVDLECGLSPESLAICRARSCC